MADYRIQPATPADFPIIQSIAQRTWPDTFGDILSPEQITYMLDMMYSIPAMTEQIGKGHTFLLLLEKSAESANYPEAAAHRYTPVGYVSYQFDYLEGTTKIHKLYLLPATQGRGYGKALIEEVDRIARRGGQQKLRLDVNYQNKAVSFYEYLGFEKIGRFNADIGNGYLMEDWQMEKELVD
ncbi:GNAT family N-acetyltransferase [Neolewinella agarilytica]|uniref:GNAT family N-acetyltransferase n=1 Tax=Neolewinella agarilytica TaxID=478744 RepID=UPI0023567949|nr:GNAT family N-acetyltransferase [Neolewinella agarilytica]